MSKHILYSRISYLLTLLSIIFWADIDAQTPAQTIRGAIKDAETQQSIPGAAVAVYQDSTFISGSSSNLEGFYRIENVPVGRYTLIVSSLGYNQILSQIIVNSAKETITNMELEESVVSIQGVEVSASRKGEALNEMAVVSARTFSVDETERYAGSRGDPARMASNFAGVAGSDDSRNDIVVRGNSPLGVVYKLDGINIPNPNHFAISGSTGGPVGILNNKVMATSDFFSSAFPAEYGNSIAAVFDIRLRKGNDERHEYTGQFGLLGTELTGEGPINKNKRSSYLFNYRYATLDILVKLGIDIGTSAIPKYQDLSFKLNFPTKKSGTVSLFGIGGLSKIDFLVSSQKLASEREIYSKSDQDEYFGAGMGVVGLNWSKQLREKSFSKLSIAAAKEQVYNHFDRVNRHLEGADSVYVIDSIFEKMDYRFNYNKYSISWYVNTKFNAQHSIKYGFSNDLFHFNYVDSILNESIGNWDSRIDYDGVSSLIQPFIQWKFRINDVLSFNAGLHGQVLSHNRSWSIEPRAGLKWQLASRQSINIGVGMHSQLQPYYVYFLKSEPYDSSSKEQNLNLDFTRSIHTVLGYDVFFEKNLRLKLEAYYQHLYNIPIEKTSSAYSILNEGDGFDRFFPDKLVNEGSGQNYGVEMTIEKFYHRNYFFMITGSLYESKYIASNGIKYDGDFNGNYVLNLLGTKEFHWGKKNSSSFGLGGKITWAGGLRYTPVDTAASDAAAEIVYVDELTNSKQFKDYFRLDLKINYKINSKKLTHEIGFDLVNLSGRKNVLRLQYDEDKNSIDEVYQLGFLPLFYYRVDF